MTIELERPTNGLSPQVRPRTGELGNTLSRARRARAITLEDVERDTRVSKRYLAALEDEDFSIFPAPVYARGFLRTYSRYLGLNPEELLRIFPNGDLTVDIAPLPSVVRPPAELINVNWLVAGLVAIFLLGAGLLLLRGGEDPASSGDLPGSTTASRNETTAGGSVQAPPSSALSAPVQGKAIGTMRPGQYPDFVGADLASSLSVLYDNGLNFLIIAVRTSETPAGLVMSQSPGPGAKADDNTAITLVVSRAPASQ
ncbi:MAG TPA: helix-turn-helix domain-containing protein [Dehalococcoidia bacterium]|nr:helix-turn-helix domain-containing protein [Dehalococcoidia bacterium]